MPVARGGSPLAACSGGCRNSLARVAVSYNAGRLGAGFISVCLETRWLGHFGGFYVPG